MYLVREERCSGCGICVEACPQAAISLEEGRARIDAALCNGCGACVEVCPTEAIEPVREAAQAHPARADLDVPEAAPTEIITVRVPPPPAVSARPPTLARRVLPAVGAALVYLGREIGPRLARLAVEVLEERLARRSTESPPGERSARSGAGRRRRRRGRS